VGIWKVDVARNGGVTVGVTFSLTNGQYAFCDVSGGYEGWSMARARSLKAASVGAANSTEGGVSAASVTESNATANITPLPFSIAAMAAAQDAANGTDSSVAAKHVSYGGSWDRGYYSSNKCSGCREVRRWSYNGNSNNWYNNRGQTRDWSSGRRGHYGGWNDWGTHDHQCPKDNNNRRRLYWLSGLQGSCDNSGALLNLNGGCWSVGSNWGSGGTWQSSGGVSSTGGCYGCGGSSGGSSGWGSSSGTTSGGTTSGGTTSGGTTSGGTTSGGTTSGGTTSGGGTSGGGVGEFACCALAWACHAVEQVCTVSALQFWMGLSQIWNSLHVYEP
jgi:hypothetical protein